MLFLNGFNAATIDVEVACAVFEAVFLINVYLVALSTNTVKQAFVLPLQAQDTTLSASKCPNSSLLFASSSLNETSILFGIFFPVPMYENLLFFFDFLPCFLQLVFLLF